MHGAAEQKFLTAVINEWEGQEGQALWTAPNPQSAREGKLVFLPRGGLHGQCAMRKGLGMLSCSEFTQERRGCGLGPPGTQLFLASQAQNPALGGPHRHRLTQPFIVHILLWPHSSLSDRHRTKTQVTLMACLSSRVPCALSSSHN